jgi:hypothetical protein
VTSRPSSNAAGFASRDGAKGLANVNIAASQRNSGPLLPVVGDEASGWKAGKREGLQNVRASAPAFSPDGRSIAYEWMHLDGVRCTCGRFSAPRASGRSRPTAARFLCGHAAARNCSRPDRTTSQFARCEVPPGCSRASSTVVFRD